MDKVNRASRIRAVHAVPVELELWGIPRSMRADKCCSALARILPLPCQYCEERILPFHGNIVYHLFSWKYCEERILPFHGNYVSWKHLCQYWRHKCAIKNCASYMMTSNLHGNIVYHVIGPWLLLQTFWYNLSCWFSSCCAGDRSFIYKGRCQSLAIPMALSAAAPGKGGVLDRPVEKTTPGRQSEFDVK